MNYSNFMTENVKTRIKAKLKKADDQHELSNIDDIIKDMKRIGNLKGLAYLAVDLQKTAKKFEKTGSDEDYDDMLDAYDKLMLNL